MFVINKKLMKNIFNMILTDMLKVIYQRVL